jgi:hypothetical protein
VFTRQDERRLKKVFEQLAYLDQSRDKMLQDELDEAAQQRPPYFAWNDKASRVKCRTLEAQEAILRGAASHPDAIAAPLKPEPQPFNPYRHDGQFWHNTLKRCRTALGQREPKDPPRDMPILHMHERGDVQDWIEAFKPKLAELKIQAAQLKEDFSKHSVPFIREVNPPTSETFTLGTRQC